MKKLLFTLLSTSIFVQSQSFVPDSPELDLKSYILIEPNTNTVIAEFNSESQIEPASMTKIMTSYVVADQIADIFRVGDFVKYPNQPDEEKSYLEVGKVMYTNGLDFVGEDTSKNGSAVAKYITKEVSITSPATAIDVHLLANVKDISNLEVFYKFKKASSQENFDDIDWIYFNKKGEPDTYEIATSENTISGIVEKQSAYQDLKYTASNLPEYSSFAIKIVMKGVDPAYVPKIQDIRAVAAF